MKLYLIRLRNILQSRYLFKILFIFSICYAIIYFKVDNTTSIYNTSDNLFEGVISNYKITSDKYTIYLKGKENLVVYYSTDLELDIDYGDTIKVLGKLTMPTNNTIPNQFNYKEYLKRKHIYYIVNAEEIEKTKNNENIIYDLKKKLINKIDKIPKSSSYIKAFVLGLKNDIDEEVTTSYQENGVSHLFAISGMHISLFSTVLFFLVKKISYNNYYNYTFVLTFLLFYMILLDSPVSVIRTITMFILFSLNKLFNLKIKSFDLMLGVFVVMVFLNPYVIYETSFQFSYLISFYLVLFSKKIASAKYKKLYMSIVCFLVSFPIVINNYYQVSIISIILNLLFIPLVSFIIFPLAILCLFFPFLDNILYIFISILENISLFVNKEIFKISFPKPNIYLIIVYYLLITLMLINRKYVIPFLLTIFFHKNYYYFSKTLSVTYLDVSQGDSILITYKAKTILIDTGGSYYSKELSLKRTIPYLKSLGRKKLDYLIITHGDYDHMGEAINLVNNYEVGEVIFNCGGFNDLENELINVLNSKKIPYYSCVSELDINDVTLYFLNNKLYSDENNSSSVIYLNYNGYEFLFMGDAGVEAEEDILASYNLYDIDVLKVGHHGSKTSSSQEFISKINPIYSVISVGKNNRYNHPNKEVLDVLKLSKVYRTDYNGSIRFSINNKLKIKTYDP